MQHNLERLKAHILPLSEAGSFDEARLEWKLFAIELHEDFDTCPCGQPIKELCLIRNQLNDVETYVGNVCINRFLGIETGNLFEGLKRIAADETANPNADLIYHAYELGYIYDRREYDFLMSTRFTRNLSPRQSEWKRKINRRIVNQTVVRRD